MKSRTKAFFLVTATIEASTGIALIVVPSIASSFLGTAIEGNAALTVGRIAGAALLALGLGCWLARNDEKSEAAGGLITGMLIYNLLAVAVLAYAGAVARLAGIGIWPAVALHSGLAMWCIIVLRARD